MPKVSNSYRPTMVDESSVLDSMAVGTNQNKVLDRIILPVSILVMESQNLGMLGIPAQRTFVYRPSPFFECTAESVGMNSKWLSVKPAFLAAKPSVIRLALGTRKVVSAVFAGVEFGRLKSNASHLRSTFSRAVGLRLTAFPERGELHSTKEARSEVLCLDRTPLTVAFSRAKTRIGRSCRMHVKITVAVFASLIFTAPDLIFTALRSSHALIINQNLDRCNHA